jgi:hypothetical protein
LLAMWMASIPRTTISTSPDDFRVRHVFVRR